MTAKDYLQKPCTFIAPDGKQLAGIIVECVETVPYGKGNVPDYICKVRGNSGRTMDVSVCESYLRLTE